MTIPVAQFAGTFTDPNYYDKSYPWPSQNVDFNQVQAYVAVASAAVHRDRRTGPEQVRSST